MSDRACGESSPPGVLHVLFSPRAEGCPRLALDLIAQERLQRGSRARAAFLVAEPDDLSRLFRDRCGGVHALPWKSKGFLALGIKAFRLLKAVRPVGVVCYTLGQHVPIAIAARMLGIPVVVHVGNAAPRERAVAMKFRLVMKAGEPFVRMHVACSDAVARDCRAVYGLRKVISVRNGIDLERFTPIAARGAGSGPAIGTPRGQRRIGMVASLESHKDHEVLIDAIAVMRSRGTDVRLVLAGDGSLREALIVRAREKGVSDSIDWLGSVTDVRSVLASLDVFAFATTESEGLGIALVEALACGLPVVASDVPACREVLGAGSLGSLVSKRDPTVWADELSNALATGLDRADSRLDQLTNFDIRSTWRSYERALGLG